MSVSSTDKESEKNIIKESNLKMDDDQHALMNKNRRCKIFVYLFLDTGFAFAEDVANIGILNHRILDNFFDLKFNN